MFITRLWLLLTSLTFATTQTKPEPKPCKINEDTVGECILVQLCPQALALLKLNDIKSLRSLTCGYDKLDAKVCCAINKPDEMITFKNNTQAIATSRPESLLPNTGRLPLVPAVSQTNTPTEPTYTNAPYSTTITILTSDRNNSDMSSSGSSSSSGAGGFSETEKKSKPDSTNVIANPPNSQSSSILPEKSPTSSDQSEIFPSLPQDTLKEVHETITTSPEVVIPLPDRRTCGLITTADRIFGGSLAAIDELPWLVRIKFKLNSKEVYACSGSLINDRYVITAAHCVLNLTIIDVRLGEWDAQTENDCYDGVCSDPPVDLKIDKAIIHPSFSKRTYLGDIALLRLERPVNFTDFIRPICLPNTEYVTRRDYDPDSSYLTGGWGKTEYESRSVIKRKLRLNAVPMQTCRVALPQVIDVLTAQTICAGGRKGEDSCIGDSGGSLVKQLSENFFTNWFLVGVTSFGVRECGSEGIPGVYTRVTTYMDWIMRTITS